MDQVAAMECGGLEGCSLTIIVFKFASNEQGGLGNMKVWLKVFISLC